MHVLLLVCLLIVGTIRIPRRFLGLRPEAYSLLLFVLFGLGIFPNPAIQENTVLIVSIVTFEALLVVGSLFVPAEYGLGIMTLNRLRGKECLPSDVSDETADRILRENWGKADIRADALEAYIKRHGCLPDGSKAPPSGAGE